MSEDNVCVDKKLDGLDYEAEYHRLKHIYQETYKENEELRRIIINMAIEFYKGRSN
jgi:hypothetical protein